jgi:hypothetical protein
MSESKRDPERRDAMWALGAAVAVHVVIIGVFLNVRSNDASRRLRDVPMPPEGIAGDSLPMSGLASSPDEPAGTMIRCAYSAANGKLSLVEGEPRRRSDAGCSEALEAAIAIPASLEVFLGLDGYVDSVKHQSALVHDTAVIRTIRDWRLAVPRRGREWPYPLRFVIEVRQ